MSTHADQVVASNLPAARASWLWWCVLFGGDIPYPFLLAWIAIESGGNACPVTSYGEAGIFQLMPPDNMTEAGTTADKLRDGCGTDGGLTLAARVENIVSGVRYINAQRAKVATWAPWASSSTVDYWRLVKMCHVAPAVVKSHGPSSTSWDDFVSKASAAGVSSSWLENAAAVGAYGSSPLLTLGAKVAAVGGTLWLATRSKTG